MTEIEEREYVIELPGLPAESHPQAVKDIRFLAKVAGVFAEKCELPFMLERVRVTNRFEDDVRGLLQERFSPAKYAATRNNVCAIGKTLPTRSKQGEFRFTVLIDGNSVVPWSIGNPWCLTTVLHEFFHVVYEGRQVKGLGEEEDSANGDYRESLLNGLASSLLNENYVDCSVDAIVREIATKENGEPYSLLELEEAKGSDWVTGLLHALDQMPKFVDEKILKYQIRKITIDELAEEVIPNVKDILILLSHTSSVLIGTKRWPGILEQIRDSEAYQRFLTVHLEKILSQFDVDRLPFEASIQLVADAVEGIFQNCGLTFRNHPEGLYINVDTPSR